MTWYWWKHWFWITNLLTIIVILSFPLLAETYPVTPIYNKENKKDKISKISLVEQTDSDIDHIFDGRDNLPRELLLIHRDRANHIPGGLDKDQLDSSVNHNHHNHQTTDSITESSTSSSSSSSSLSSIANIFLNSTANNTNSNETHTISNDGENLNEQTNSSKTFINNSNNSSRTTKVVDYSIVINNTSSEIMNNDTINFNRDNHLINIDKNFTLSTTNISSTIINSNTSKLIIVASENKSFICNKTKIDSTVQRSAVESNRTNIKNNNSTVSSIQINNNKTIDCENATNDSEELSSSTLDIDSIENHNNKTTKIHVDLIDDDNDDDDNISSDNNDNIDNNNNNNNNNDKDNKNNANTLIHHMQNKGTKMENITKDEEIIRAEIQRQLDGERGRKSKVLAEYRHELKYINFSSDAKNLLARSAAVSLDFDVHDDDGNVSSEALSIQKAYILDAGTISGICLSVLGLCLAVTLAGIAIYRRRYLNKPQTLSEPDSSGYIDDSTIRDNSDEMYSLDNDSFLNSLEAMTIQNYWTDTVKHTKL